jgi:hypothetical protein
MGEMARDQQQAAGFVVRGLEERLSRDEIVRALCEQTGWPWQRVEQFVHQVEVEHQSKANQFVAAPAPQREEHQAQVVVASSPQHYQPRAEAAAAPSPEPYQGQAGALASPPAQHHQRRAEPDEETTEFVIHELSRHRSRNDIVSVLCEQNGWSWKDAQRLVQKIEIEHHGTIAARQSPLLIVLGVGSIIVGLAMAAYTVLIALNGEFYAESVGFFITGVGLVLGGIAGVWRTLSLTRE